MPRNWTFLTDILSQHIFLDNGRNFCLPQMKQQSPRMCSLLLLCLPSPALKPQTLSGFWALTDGPSLSAGCLSGVVAWSHVCDGSSCSPFKHQLIDWKWGRRWNLPGFSHLKLCFVCNSCIPFLFVCFPFVSCCVVSSGILLKCKKEPPDNVYVLRVYDSLTEICAATCYCLYLLKGWIPTLLKGGILRKSTAAF